MNLQMPNWLTKTVTARSRGSVLHVLMVVKDEARRQNTEGSGGNR